MHIKFFGNSVVHFFQTHTFNEILYCNLDRLKYHFNNRPLLTRITYGDDSIPRIKFMGFGCIFMTDFCNLFL